MGDLIKQTDWLDFGKLSVITTTGAEIAFSKSLSLQKQKAGDVRVFLVQAIVHACDYLSVPKMTEEQVVKTVNLLMASPLYMELKPEDFALCLNRALSGKYGKVFNRIDGLIICEWLNQYIVEREQEIIEANIKKKEERGRETSVLDERMAKKFGDLARKLQASEPKWKQKKEIKKETEEEKAERTEFEKSLDEFKTLAKEQGKTAPIVSMIFIDYKGNWVDFQEYLRIKHFEKFGNGCEPCIIDEKHRRTDV